MIAAETRELLRRLRSGRMDVADTDALEKLPANVLVEDIKNFYNILFQERQVRNKHEVSLARSLKVEFSVRRHPNSLFAPIYLHPVLSKCLFVSSYEDTISEITMAASIHVLPRGGEAKEVILKLGRGHKLDRTPDGWMIKPLERRSVTLSESLLSKRGWKFGALLP